MHSGRLPAISSPQPNKVCFTITLHPITITISIPISIPTPPPSPITIPCPAPSPVPSPSPAPSPSPSPSPCPGSASPDGFRLEFTRTSGSIREVLKVTGIPDSLDGSYSWFRADDTKGQFVQIHGMGSAVWTITISSIHILRVSVMNRCQWGILSTEY